MQKLTFLTIGALFVLPAVARSGPLTDKAYQVAAQLSSHEPSLTSPQQAQLGHELDTMLQTLNGHPPLERVYSCVSRDNDNTRPFVLAYKDFANLIRFSNATYDSKDECEQAMAAGQHYMDRFFVCASRDNDGLHPYKIVGAGAGPTAVQLERSVIDSFDDCLTATRAMQLRPEGVLYCGSRDNDGMHPFAQTGFRSDGSFVQSRDDFSTLTDCITGLKH